MHEMAMAQTILAAALAELKKHPAARLKTVRVVVGQQHAVVTENLRFAFEVLRQATPAAHARLAVVVRPVTARCRRCGWTGEIKSALYACAACGESDIAITGGDELYLDSLEVDC
jgi:hydrogenase nickel incorporation protein HypA/HybF